MQYGPQNVAKLVHTSRFETERMHAHGPASFAGKYPVHVCEIPGLESCRRLWLNIVIIREGSLAENLKKKKVLYFRIVAIS